MKKYVFLLICLMAAISVHAEDNSKEYHVRLTKTDGTVFEGYNNTRLRNWLKPKVTSVSISKEYQGPAIKYTSEEVKRLVFVESLSDSIPVVFDAVKAQSKRPTLFSKNPKPYKEPIFLRLVYDGNNVKGYAMPITDATYVPSMTKVHYTWRYFYLTKDSDVAVAYWDDVDDIIPGMKKVMKFYLREFPELVEMVDKEEITARDFRDNPTIVLPLIDKTYSPKE
ncbi:hypothetical protein [uncultured Bacteroides sp.]|uniref:hypothetical protein n=1 Tax=uncultured Bacteroides sp. TaxID=162156 RepID=UPI00266FCA48|nr:hypothetical protein [uncultured Bacteroides sp.]